MVFYRFNIFLLISFLSLLPVITVAGHPSHGPISLRSQNPLYLLFLQPRPEGARVLDEGQLKLSARGPYSNMFEVEGSNRTGMAVDLDMELFRPSFLVQYGFSPGWEIGLEVPFLHFEGGFLDSFIQDFHDAFGLPNAGRETVANGRFSYRVSQNGRSLYTVGTEAFRPSDFIFHVKKELLSESPSRPALSGTGYLKIPVGSRPSGTGSGLPDIAFNLAAEKHYKRLHGYANLGWTILGEPSFGLSPFLNRHLWNWMVGFEVTAWSHHLGINVQLQGDGSLFDGTGLESLDEGNLLLTIGLAGQEGPWGWRFAFVEDASGTGPAVDFTTFFELSYTWDFQ